MECLPAHPSYGSHMVKRFPNKYLFNSVIMAVLVPFPLDNSSQPSWSPGRLNQKVPRHRLLEWTPAYALLSHSHEHTWGWGELTGTGLGSLSEKLISSQISSCTGFSVLAPSHFIHASVLLTCLLHAPLNNCNTLPPYIPAWQSSVKLLTIS